MKRAGLLASLLSAACAGSSSPAPQNPSPMVETARAHARLEESTPPGRRSELADGVRFFLSGSSADAPPSELVVHFHGAAWVAEQAVAGLGRPVALVSVHLGAGSGVYTRAFADPSTFDELVSRAAVAAGAPAGFESVTLTAFSAGYGAVREILRSGAAARVAAVLLLDGLHASYVPERRVLAEGGTIDAAGMTPFVRFAEAAVRGERRMLITHSEIFPGTFASTTETADHVIDALGLRRMPVLEWGPLGMQQISEAGRSGLRVLGFAGNTAPDHIDHLHALPAFLARVMPLANASGRP